jgi:hypothetical protein
VLGLAVVGCEALTKIGDWTGVDTQSPITNEELQGPIEQIGVGATATLATGLPIFLILSFFTALGTFIAGRIVGRKKPEAALDAVTTAVYETRSLDVAHLTKSILSEAAKVYLTKRLNDQGTNLLEKTS